MDLETAIQVFTIAHVQNKIFVYGKQLQRAYFLYDYVSSLKSILTQQIFMYHWKMAFMTEKLKKFRSEAEVRNFLTVLAKNNPTFYIVTSEEAAEEDQHDDDYDNDGTYALNQEQIAEMYYSYLVQLALDIQMLCIPCTMFIFLAGLALLTQPMLFINIYGQVAKRMLILA